MYQVSSEIWSDGNWRKGHFGRHLVQIVRPLQININKNHSYKQPNTTHEDDQRNGRKCLGEYGELSSPSCPRHKKNEETRTSSLEHFEKETVSGLQPNIFWQQLAALVYNTYTYICIYVCVCVCVCVYVCVLIVYILTYDSCLYHETYSSNILLIIISCSWVLKWLFS